MAKASYNEARMTPVATHNQSVRQAHVSVQPSVPLYSYVDYFGTTVTAFDIQDLHTILEVEARSTVESRAAILERPINWGQIRDERLVDTYSEYLGATARTQLSHEALANAAAWPGQLDLHECARAVGDFVRTRVQYVPGATTVSSTAEEAWSRGEGVCQDITHITIGLLRTLGIPARYVSGYLYPSSDSDIGDVVAGQSHAWVEYFSGVWTGWDPTNGVGETENHIIVGRGRDYDDVAPLKGIYQGPSSSSLGVSVEMSRIV
ncbi:MAG: transglutaminase family protein [Acidimicrobiaceae bacterium]|nr:transglutaminase family protein [Acidimicrobiaceae bacterium]